MTATPSPSTVILKTACAQHEAYLRGRLRGLGVHEAALDDAVQDVFEVLVRRIGAYDSRFSLRQWMAGVARKIARRHRERMQRAPETVDEERVASSGLDPERWAARREALASVQEFLGELDADRWAVFVLSEIEGLRGTEIAAELGVNLSTVYARLRVAKESFEKAMARRRRAERRSWLLVPLFGEPASRPLGSAAFVTPIALLGVLTIGGGGLVAVRGCGDSNAGSASEANEGSANAVARGEAAVALGVPAREADPAHGPSLAGLAGEAGDEGWIAGGSGVSSAGEVAWSEHTRYRLSGDEVIVEIEHLGDDTVATNGGVGWVELEGFTRVEGPGSWPIALAAGERLVITLRLRATRPGVVRADLFHGPRMGEFTTGGGIWLVLEGGRLRRCREHECERTADSVIEGMFGETMQVELRNECGMDIELAMLPCEVMSPPRDAPRLRLKAGEVRPTTMDAGLCLGRVRDDGRLGSHVGASDGFIITFLGADCGGVRADSRDMPPGSY